MNLRSQNFKIRSKTVSIVLDDEEFILVIKPASFESINYISLNSTYDDKKQFFFDNILEPDKDNLKRIIEQYPILVESFANQYYTLFSNDIRQINNSLKDKWKESEKNIGDTAMKLIKFFDKPITEDNFCIALLLLDGLGCLRHLRLAYSAKK